MEFDEAKYAKATIVSRRDCADDLWVIRVRAEVELSFRPGQYVTIGLPRNGRIIERPYSIASAPSEGELELFIERVPEGELSAPLFTLRDGEELLVRRRCKGLFLKEVPQDGTPCVFVSTVTGVAPFVSFVRALHRQRQAGEANQTGNITILQGASVSGELGYADELTALEHELDWFSYVPTVSRPWEDAGWNGETGRVEDVLRKYADQAGVKPSSGGIFLCGHPGMISNGRAIMRRRGVDDKAIREEQYWPD